jgi:hypothetical protein
MSNTSVRALGTALAMALTLAWGAPASAQQAKCLAGKTKCVAKKATGLIKCEQLAETPGKPADPNAGGCVDKVVAKFDGGVDPTKGCFEKLENKNPNDCLTFDDTGSAESAVDSCVQTLVEEIDEPPLSQTKCGAGKKKCVSKYLKALLKCRALSQTPGKSTDPNAGGCVDKAVAKYTGGIDPTKGCFEKLENKLPNDCDVFDDTATLQGLAEDCDDDLLALLTNTTTTSTSTSSPPTTSTSSTSSTSTTLPLGMVVGALAPPTKGRFNYNSMVGLPAVNAACPSQFPGSHPCTQAELAAAPAGDLMGLQDSAAATVTSLWAINNSAPPLEQCQDDNAGGTLLNWEYGTAHTVSRGRKFALNNGTGVLTGPTLEQCFLLGTTSWVACCQ